MLLLENDKVCPQLSEQMLLYDCSLPVKYCNIMTNRFLVTFNFPRNSTKSCINFIAYLFYNKCC